VWVCGCVCVWARVCVCGFVWVYVCVGVCVGTYLVETVMECAGVRVQSRLVRRVGCCLLSAVL